MSLSHPSQQVLSCPLWCLETFLLLLDWYFVLSSCTINTKEQKIKWHLNTWKMRSWQWISGSTSVEECVPSMISLIMNSRWNRTSFMTTLYISLPLSASAGVWDKARLQRPINTKRSPSFIKHVSLRNDWLVTMTNSVTWSKTCCWANTALWYINMGSSS